MKTITEFSGVLLQRAAEAQRAFRAEHPHTETSAAHASPPPAEATATDEVASESATAVDANVEDVAAAGNDSAAGDDAGAASAPGEATSGDAPAAAPEPALGEGPEAEAVGAAMQLEGDRLARLMEALDVVGRKVGQVRLVRVVQGETAPQGAQKRGEFFYLVDLMPRPQSRQEFQDGRDGDRRRGPGGRDRGGRPGGGRGGPRGPGGPGGSFGGGPGAGRGGKFSADRPGGRDGEREARGEMPRGGVGWTLTRAPDDRRGQDERGGPGAGRRGDRRPPRPPRDGNRGPRPPMGDSRARGPRPEGARPGGRFEGGGMRPRPEGQGAGPNPEERNLAGRAAPHPGERGPGSRGPGPRRPEGGNGRRPDGGGWSGRRRGGWDEEPVVVEATEHAAPPAAPAEPAEKTADRAPVDATQSEPGTPPPSEDAS